MTEPPQARPNSRLRRRLTTSAARDSTEMPRVSSRRLHWCRVRLLFVGGGEVGSPLSKLDRELLHVVASHVMAVAELPTLA